MIAYARKNIFTIFISFSKFIIQQIAKTDGGDIVRHKILYFIYPKPNLCHEHQLLPIKPLFSTHFLLPANLEGR